ncbi:trehalose import ATP-binding protein SugC [Fibrobacterales bacterium]|nr:trehalose import ATP-binding protein SugC [Fibrobacterales bacterium]
MSGAGGFNSGVGVSLENIALYDRDSQKPPLLSEVSLEIKAQEFFVLVGPSGCGKSHILRVIAGLADGVSGTVLFNGQTLTEFSPDYRNIAMAFQTQALYPHLTVKQNLEFNLKLSGLPRETIAVQVAEIANLIEITDILDLKPAKISKAKRQLVALARAFVKHPKILLLDEPLSELDSRARMHYQSVLRWCCNNLHITTIYTTHSPTEALTLGDRVACMDGGKILQVGTSAELYNKPVNETVAKFIGYPEINFIDVETQAEENGLFLNLIKAKSLIPAPNKFLNLFTEYSKAKLGVRAENLQIVSVDDTDFSQKESTLLQMIVEMLEFQGANTILYAVKESLSLSIIIHSTEHYEIGETVFVEILENNLLLFAEGKCVGF